MLDELVEKFLADRHVKLLVLEILLLVPLFLNLLNELLCVLGEKSPHYSPKELAFWQPLFFAMWTWQILKYFRAIFHNRRVAVLHRQFRPRRDDTRTAILQFQDFLLLRKNVLNVLKPAVLKTRHEVAV